VEGAPLAVPQTHHLDPVRRRIEKRPSSASVATTSSASMSRQCRGKVANLGADRASARRRTGGPGTSRTPCGAWFAKVWFARDSREPARRGNAFRGRHRRRGSGARRRGGAFAPPQSALRVRPGGSPQEGHRALSRHRGSVSEALIEVLGCVAPIPDDSALGPARSRRRVLPSRSPS
jgi:hypothetical protein